MRKLHRKRKWHLSLIAGGVALGLLISVGYAAAKYVSEYEKDGLYVAKSFYFESDLLKAPASNGVYPSYTLQSGVDEITFVLKNYTDALRISEANISYTITVEKNGSVLSEKKQESVLAMEDLESSVTISDLTAGTYTVTAIATAPYTSVLKADFTIVSINRDIEYSVSDDEESPVLYLTVTTNDYKGEIFIQFPENVYPDNTDEKMKDAVNTQKFYVTFDKNSQYTFLFFKENIDDKYTEENFKVGVSDNEN